ncbi:DUF1178 family protein [Asticcacaulis sp. 201]|uniref:DUF1178 family protein n=1 Tax=Asticcacaulis sp. 201 TaxID=3028787 RepID=UPI002916843F|nr:DUF1178 family protein [Asticcacaulis sp. 201]MDV6331797.1 DUF1178 family protein [Asticcacaulis sp. 201]
MIRYALRCIVAHEFEAWFSSSDGFDEQVAKGLVECPMCGSTAVSKAIMAPAVRTKSASTQGAETLAEAQRAVAEAMFRLRQHVEKTHDYVGDTFANEARDIHEGLAPDRPIYGEATPEEVKGLVEDGVPVAALPVFKPAAEMEPKAPLPLPGAPVSVDKKLN